MNCPDWSWRKLAHDEEAESAASSDAKPKFDHPEREGAGALKQNGYVEEERFEKPLMALLQGEKMPAGYFCATCSYYLHDDSKLKGGYCQKLKAEDAPWGCCNIWELNERGKIKEAGLKE